MAQTKHDSFTPDGRLKYLYLDLNSYFASVEQQENQDLIGKPVAVVPMMTDGTCAIAASYEAKAFGIKTGTKIYEAKRMCPDLICVQARHDVYVDYHKRLLKVVNDYLPIDKVYSIDEWACRLQGAEQDTKRAIHIARSMKAGIYNALGVAMTCSIGIAPNRFLAKIAAEMQKPDGLTVLQQADLFPRLSMLKLTDLPGINIRMEARLHRAGVRTVQQFMELSPKQARAIWRSVEGERFWYMLRGYNVPERVTNKSVVGHSRVLDIAHRNPEIAKDMARRLTLKAATRLRRYDLHAGALVLSVRTTQGQRWGQEIRFPHSQDNAQFANALGTLWRLMLRATGGAYLKKVSITLHALRQGNDITLDLFDQPALAAHKPRNTIALSTAMDDLNKRFGIDTIKLGDVPQTQAGHVGTKIAFNRIPEAEEFWE